jgi:hypothetical protein
LDAARRQLHTAIRLWFEDGDPVSIHTLASASHEIVHALFRAKGLKGLLFDSPIVRPEKRSIWSGLLKTSFNFFKHARHDDGTVLDFHPGINEIILTACCKGIREIGSPVAVEELAFIYWAFFTQSELFDLPETGETLLQDPKVQAIQKLVPHGRHVFWREFKTAWDKGWISATP